MVYKVYGKVVHYNTECMIFHHIHEQLKDCFNSDRKSWSEISGEVKYGSRLKLPMIHLHWHDGC